MGSSVKVHYKHVGTDRAIGMDTLHTKDNTAWNCHVLNRSSVIDNFEPALLTFKWMGLEVLERLRFLVSLPLAGTAQTEGGGIRVANHHFISHPFMWQTIQKCTSTLRGYLSKLTNKTSETAVSRSPVSEDNVSGIRNVCGTM